MIQFSTAPKYIQLPKFHLKYKVKALIHITEYRIKTLIYGGFIIFVFKVINYSLLYMPTQLRAVGTHFKYFFTYRVTDRCIFKENKFPGRTKFPSQFKILW